MPKKIITRKEFQEVLDESAIQMAEDKELQRSAKDLLARAGQVQLDPSNNLDGRTYSQHASRHVCYSRNHISNKTRFYY